MGEFDDALYNGYEMEDLPQVKSETPEYYNHPAGQYLGSVARYIPIYKDITNKKCKRDDPGAIWTGGTLKTLLRFYEGKQLLGDGLVIPSEAEKNPFAYYHTMFLPAAGKDQWQNHNKFADWKIGSSVNSMIVQVNPAKQTEKITVFNNFKHYYGLPVIMQLDTGAKTGKSYVASIALGDQTKRIPADIMAETEKALELLVEAMKNRKSEDIQREAPPETDIDNLLKEDDASDLPF